MEINKVMLKFFKQMQTHSGDYHFLQIVIEGQEPALLLVSPTLFTFLYVEKKN